MKKTLPLFDFRLMAPVLFLITISLTILYSINPIYFWNQIVALILALLIFIIISQIAYTDYRNFTFIFYLGTLFLLTIVFFLGFESRGAVRWIEIFGFSFQSSEIAKPLLALVLASFLSRRPGTLKTYMLVLIYFMPVFILIFLQPDLGNALLFLSVLIMTLLVNGLPILWFILSIVPLALTFPFIWNLLKDYQKLRVLTFLNPFYDPGGSSYNLIQAIIAVGSGGVIGKGIGEGTQSQLKFLPENHTDFIFASIAEKLGFLGSLFVVIFFILLLLRIYIIFLQAKDAYTRVLVASCFLFIIIQFFVNIGMNLGIVPIVGITLPFVSYGGSSLVASFIILGVLSSISVRNNRQEVLEIR